MHTDGKIALAVLAAFCCTSPSWGQDVTPPALQSLTFSPSSINVTNGPQNVIVTARITDSMSGVANSPFAFYSPPGPSDSQVQMGTFGASNLISGNANDGVYQVTLTFPQYSQSGTWYISYVYLNDQVGNTTHYQQQDLTNLGFSTTLQVTSLGADVTPPVVRSLTISPGLIDVTNGPQSVTVTARITDDISGVANSTFAFYSPPGPSGSQVQMGTFGPSNRISGNANDGIYQTTVTFPQYGQVGAWYISYLRLYDQVGNVITYQQQDLINLGLPTTLQVTEAPYSTLLSNPTGRSFTLSGPGCGSTGTFATPYDSIWMNCTATWTSPDNSTPNTIYIFQNWSDSNTQNPRTFTPDPSVATTLTANFVTQYQLTTQAVPASGGSASASGFYDAGTAVPITAIPSNGYSFTGWTGSVASSSSSSTTVTMSGPETVTANFFTSLIGITIQTNPAGLMFSVDGGAAQTAPQTVLLSQGPHIVTVLTPQAGPAATQYVFTGWSDGGAAAHSINVTSAASFTASFKPQYQSGFAFSTINFAGSTNTVAYGVNNSGQIVGGENANGGTSNGFLSSGGTYTTFNVTPSSTAGSIAEGINSSGQIVGLNLANGTGFLLSAGTFTTITVPGSDSGTTNAIGINDSGQIVGTFLKGGVEYGFLLSGGTYTTIAAPGATTTVAYGINNSGQIVGWFTGSGGTLGFLLSGGNYTLLGFPGSGSTKAFGINNSGQVVGEYSNGGSTASGFLWQGGNYMAVSVPNSAASMAVGINDAGQIVGTYVNGGTVFGFSAAQNTESVSIREYPAIPSGSSGNALGAITAGPDGAMWFTGVPTGNPFGALAIGRITTPGMTSFSIINLGPNSGSFGFGIAPGQDGALWFATNTSEIQECGRFLCTVDDAEIRRISTSGVLSAYDLGNPYSPAGVNGITAGPDGALWFSDGGLNEIGRITTSGVITLFPVTTSNSVLPVIAAGPDGALWFTEATANQIGRITTAGVITEFPIPTTASSPFGIAAGPDGALWFTETNGNKIGRISTGGAISEYPVPTAGAAPYGIALGPDGALWFAESSGNNIGRITVLGTITEYPVPTPSSGPMGVAAGPDGALWFTETSGNIGQIVAITNPTPPVLSVTKTHMGSFAQGQTNAAYTVTVSNQGATPTSGTVTVSERVPGGLTLVSMTGGGWGCAGNTCERSDVLPAGSSYPAIIVTVSVAVNATSPQVNQVIVWGGGSVNAAASDITTITAPAPALAVTKTHTGNFAPGQTNATYTLTVSNIGGAASNGMATVTDTLPSGLSLVSMAGVPPCNATNCGGWICVLNSCMRSDSLAAGASYPAIIVTVNVASGATSPQVNAATVTGGGSPPASATDSTVITSPPQTTFFTGEQNLGSGVYYLTFPDGNLFGYYEHLAGSFLYHYDMGFEYVAPSDDANGDVYFYDFESGHWWYTGPTLFPNLYDFTLGAWIYYFTDPSNPGHYTTNPRKFAYDTTHVTFTM